MKNKRTTYILIISVIAVWGIIFYRIFTATQAAEPVSFNLPASRASYESLDDYQLKDTFTLALNYRDPFLGGVSPAEAAVVPEPRESAAFTMNAIPPPPPVNWEIIRYTGYIMNPNIRRVVAIININGKEYMLSEGQKADGVTLVKSYRDSVKISYQHKTKFIRIQ